MLESHSVLRLVLLGTLVTCACGGDSTPQPPATGAAKGSPISITGTEKIAWNQAADNANELARLRYISYVDDAPQLLADAVCDRISGSGLFACQASLPPMSFGLHQIQLASEEVDGLQRRSERSSALAVNLVVAQIPTANRSVARAETTSDGLHLVVETLATGLTAPSALATTPDGRVFVAERNGSILVWEGGELSTRPAFELGDVVQTSETGLIGIAVHPDFSTNGRMFIAYTAHEASGGLVNRVIRLRDVRNSLGQAAVILQDRVTGAPMRPPRIRIGPDRVVYVTFPATSQATAESLASYMGKILRINEDGTTPRDNPGATPIIASGNGVSGGFDWQPTTGRLWIADRGWLGDDFIRDFVLRGSGRSTFDSPVDPSGMVFYRSRRIGGFANDMFIGALTGRHLRRVRFSQADPGRVESTERLLNGQYGRIGSVAAGFDGALYIGTSNAGSAYATAEGDRLLRLTSEN